MAASNGQVQQYVNERTRVRCEQVRSLLAALKDDKSAVDDVYAAVTQGTPTWVDTRPDGPPHLLTPTDVATIAQFTERLITAIETDAQLPVVLKACVRPVE